MDITHACIKCRKPYEGDGVEAYLCPGCLEARRAIAAQVDARVGSTAGQQPSSGFQEYEAARRASGARFVNARDLGL